MPPPITLEATLPTPGPSLWRRLRRWWRADARAASRDAYRRASSTYSPQLIPRLCHDHRKLLARYHGLLDLLACGDDPALPRELDLFKASFDAHVAQENLRFYAEIEARLQGQAKALKQIQDFQREMDRIGRVLLAFLARYRDAGVTPVNRAAFEAELRQVGALLAQRIEREESELYPLYEG